LTRDGDHVATVLAGGWWGHTTLLAGATVESVTAIATVPTLVYVCSRREFTSLLAAIPELRSRLVDNVVPEVVPADAFGPDEPALAVGSQARI
jgi:hypothetical protein